MMTAANVRRLEKRKGAARAIVAAASKQQSLATLRLFFSFFFLISSDFNPALILFRATRAATGQYRLLPPVTAARPGVPAPPAPVSDSSSESGDSFHSNPWGSLMDEIPYLPAEALVFHRERDEARQELGEVSKQFGKEQAEWDDQQKQFCDSISSLFFLIHIV